MFFKKKTEEDEKNSILNKKFQFIKGEKFNQIVTVVSIKEPYIIFDDESRVSRDVFDEFLVPIETVDQDFSFENLKKQSVLQGQNMSQDLNSAVKDLAPQIPVGSTKQTPVLTNTKSPLMLILEKQTPVDIEFVFKLKAKVPNKALIDVLKSSFGDEETLIELKEYVFLQIDLTEFRESLSNSIEKHFDIQKQQPDDEKA